MDHYEHIQLTSEEFEEAIIAAKKKKEGILKQRAIEERAAENRKFFTGYQWDYKQTDAFMRYRASQMTYGQTGWENGFKIDDDNRAVYEMLCLYFSKDKNFLSVAKSALNETPSLEKGILLSGIFGTGKTAMMELFSRNQRQVFTLVDAKKIANDFGRFGEESTLEHETLIENASNDSTRFFHKYTGLCIDDIGTEDLKTHYGNKKNVIGDLIEQRYSKGNVGVYLHATTNLTAKQLEEYYGGRVKSRLREIFNVIVLPGKDRRK